jgi:hypothetical protein
MPTMTPPPGSALMPSTSIADQVQSETDEERKRRLQAIQNAKGLPGDGTSSLAAGYGAALGAY